MKTSRIAIAALTLIVATTSTVNAQWGYNAHQNQGHNYGHQSQTNWQVQGGMSHQNPGAALVGGILGAIGGGLNAANPQKHAVASNVLGGLGQTFHAISGPQYYQQGQINHRQQGYRNQWNNQGLNVRPIGYQRPMQQRPMQRPMGGFQGGFNGGW